MQTKKNINRKLKAKFLYKGGEKDVKLMLNNKILRDFYDIKFLYDILGLDKVNKLKAKLGQIVGGYGNPEREEIIKKIRSIMKPENLGQLIIQNNRLLMSYKKFVLLHKLKVIELKHKYDKLKKSKIGKSISKCARWTRKTVQGLRSKLTRRSSENRERIISKGGGGHGSEKKIETQEYLELGLSSSMDLISALMASGHQIPKTIIDIGDDQIDCGDNKFMNHLCNLSNFFENHHPLINSILNIFIKIFEITANLPVVTSSILLSIKGITFFNFMFRLYFANNKILTNFDSDKPYLLLEMLKIFKKVGFIDLTDEDLIKSEKDQRSIFIDNIIAQIYYTESTNYIQSLEEINKIEDKKQKKQMKTELENGFIEKSKIEIDTLKIFIQKVINSRIEITQLIDDVFNNMFHNNLLIELLNDYDVSENSSLDESKLEELCNSYVLQDLESKKSVENILEKLDNIKKLILIKKDTNYICLITLYYIILMYNSPDNDILNDINNSFDTINIGSDSDAACISNNANNSMNHMNTINHRDNNSGIDSDSVSTTSLDTKKSLIDNYLNVLSNTNMIITNLSKMSEKYKNTIEKMITYINLYVKYKLILFVNQTFESDLNLTYDEFYYEIKKKIEDELKFKNQNLNEITNKIKDKLSKITELYKSKKTSKHINSTKIKHNLEKEPLSGTMHEQLNKNIDEIVSYINKM